MKKGFTIIELLTIIAILFVLAVSAVPALRSFQLKSDLENSAEEMINVIRLAQQKTISSEGGSSWGVYFSTSTSPHQYTLFKGDDYTSREVPADEVHKISRDVLISAVDLGGGFEVVFSRVPGASRQEGAISLVLKNDASQTKTIFIDASGQISGSAIIAPSDDDRIKDSRHVHADYSRFISTTTESIILTFSYDVFIQTEIISIADNMAGGQINWEGQINVGGQTEQLKIHTHRLNDPVSGTQFSIHRDRRYNIRALTIGIDDIPDPDSGTIIEYSADGLNTISASIYASNLQWQ